MIGRSTLYNAGWKLRTIFLDDTNKLYYFDDKILKGIINLQETIINYMPPSHADGKEYAFQISNIDDVKRGQATFMLLAAGSKDEAHDWY